MTFKPKPYDSAQIVVALEGGFTFTFDVQDWEDDGANLSSARAWKMADDLARSEVELFGVLKGPGIAERIGWTILTPARVVAVICNPTGGRTR